MIKKVHIIMEMVLLITPQNWWTETMSNATLVNGLVTHLNIDIYNFIWNQVSS